MNVPVTVVIVLSLFYVLGMFVVSRRRRAPEGTSPEDLFFVAIIPCLNEELVIAASLERMRAFSPEHLAVMVVDDGSDDSTASIVQAWSVDHPGVHLLSRRAPDARQGKGEALNSAFRHLRDSDVLEGRRPQDVVLLVLDADGRIEPNALDEVGPLLADPRAGAVQIGVRMYNFYESLLARLQDFEFVTYTEIFQRARENVGSVGLGGNGQFTRMSTLSELGDAPWNDCLTEDLDLGLRLLALGYTNHYCSTTYVAQQALLSPRRLLRQRARWFQGHLQCLARLPLVLRSELSPKSTSDLVQHLLSPVLVLLMSVLPVLLGYTLVAFVVRDPAGAWSTISSVRPTTVLLAYLLAFGLTPVYAFTYWLKEGKISFPHALLLAHAFALYGFLWFPAGWRALWAVARRRNGWAKTIRNSSGPALEAQAGATDVHVLS